MFCIKPGVPPDMFLNKTTQTNFFSTSELCDSNNKWIFLFWSESRKNEKHKKNKLCCFVLMVSVLMRYYPMSYYAKRKLLIMYKKRKKLQYEKRFKHWNLLWIKYPHNYSSIHLARSNTFSAFYNYSMARPNYLSSRQKNNFPSSYLRLESIPVTLGNLLDKKYFINLKGDRL